MVYARLDYMKAIRRLFSIIETDIQLGQSLNELSLNLHMEDFYKDILNLIESGNYINANEAGHNAPYIDLVDHKRKKLVQITSTKTTEKITQSLKIFNDPNYSQYSFEIYYLLGKPETNFHKTTIERFEDKGISYVQSHFKDTSDLLGLIQALNEPEIESLYKNYIEPSLRAIKYTGKQARTIINNTPIDIFGIKEAIETLLNRIDFQNEKEISDVSLGIDLTSKNQINNFNQNYFDSEVKPHFMPLFFEIDRFLDSRSSEDLKDKIVKINSNINRRLISAQKQLEFQDLLFHLCDEICDNSSIIDALSEDEARVLLVLYYFYCSCSIGKKTQEELVC